MYFWIYNLGLILVSPIILGLLLTKKRCQRGLMPRLGLLPVELQQLQKPIIWVHAVSLGEVTAVLPMLHAMKKRYPQWPLLVSTVTETGREMVIKQLGGIATHCYAPLDFPWAVSRYVRTLQPKLFILVESELWPNLLKSLHRHQVPICLVNGRISSRSFSRYVWVKGLMRRVLVCLDVALMQTVRDAERMRELGGDALAIHVTGNMKFDQVPDLSDARYSKGALRGALRLGSEEVVLVAGSTHPKEEEILLAAYRTLIRSHPRVVLVMAPRHIERASILEQVIQEYGLKCVRRSQLASKPGSYAGEKGSRVILLDSRGELPFVYRLGYVGFVGGTLIPVGGHNLLEPAQWARPVMFGPYIDHCRDIAQRLLDEGGAIQIQNQDSLVTHMIRLIDYPSEAEKMGQLALAVVEGQRGVIAKNLQWIDQLLNSSPASSVPNTVKVSPQVEPQELLR